MTYLKSPMNYIGNKYRLLDQIIPFFPASNRFVDLFAGGLDVAINTQADVIYCNDINCHLIAIYMAFQGTSYASLMKRLETTIEKYQLSETNKDGYLKFREYYNNSDRDPIDLYLLMNYGFNYQFRFNSQHQFNNSFGKNRSSFNAAIRKRLPDFIAAIKDFHFSSVDFRAFNYDVLRRGDLIYCDPPYTISTGSYNDGKRGFTGWKEQDDMDLITILDKLSERGVHFVLSNVLSHKGMTNAVIQEWAKKYTVHDIKCSYNNSSYHLLDKQNITREVVITNA